MQSIHLQIDYVFRYASLRRTINIYVNQGNDQIKITSDEKITSIELFDINGKLVYSLNNINDYKTSVILFQKGVYILRARIADKIIIKKIVIT